MFAGSDFAADASFVIRQEGPEEGHKEWHVFVRQGDVVAMINVDGNDASEQFARTVGQARREAAVQSHLHLLTAKEGPARAAGGRRRATT